MMLVNDQAHETSLIATMYDGSPETQCHDFPNWWLNNMEQKVVWEIIPKDTIPKGRKIIGTRWVFAQNWMADTEPDVLQKDLDRLSKKCKLYSDQGLEWYYIW
jgi:hypothetical protein